MSEGLAVARRKVCHTCPHCSYRPAQYEWFTCDAPPTVRILDPAFMDSDVSRCPLRNWEGVTAVTDLGEQRRLGLARFQVRMVGPVLELALAGAADKDAALTAMVAEGVLEPEAKAAILAELKLGNEVAKGG